MTNVLQTPDARRRLALALLWVTPALWAVNYIIARSARGVAEPHMLALGRWALAGAILAFIVRAELWQGRHAALAVWHQHVVLGALGICGAWVYLGAKTTQAVKIALIYAAAPVPLGATARLAFICISGVLVLLPFAIWESVLPSTPA